MKLIHLAVVVLVASAAVSAQWLNHPTPGIPRLPDGKPDLNAPPPRTADGKPDFSGVWQFRLPVAYMMNIVSDLQPGEIKPWADAAFRRHAADFGKDDPFTVGCLPRGPRGILGSAPGGQITKITQDRNAITILFEDMSYRQIFIDGRALPQDPDPSFMGYSVGRWEGDTLIVDSIGFNDRTWLDWGGHPHTQGLRMTERLQRRRLGAIDLQVTLEDSGAYSRPWTVTVPVTLLPDTDLLEYVCHENERRRKSLSGRTPAQQRLVLPVATLSKYVGRYVLPVGSRMPYQTLDVRLVNRELVLDVDGKGSLPMVPLSVTRFANRSLELDFKADTGGVVNAVQLIPAGVQAVRQE